MSKHKKNRAKPVQALPSPPGRTDLLDRSDSPHSGPWWMWVPALVILVWIAFLYVRQGIYHVPVANRVLGGESVDANKVHLGWAPDNTAGRELEIQIAGDRGFRDLIFSRTAPNAQQRVVVRPSPEPGVYYWRMRSLIDGKRSPWTRRIRFTIVDD